MIFIIFGKTGKKNIENDTDGILTIRSKKMSNFNIGGIEEMYAFFKYFGNTNYNYT